MADVYSPEEAAAKCISVCRDDARMIERLDNYLLGIHDPIYIPDNADAEFKAIADRSILNFIPLVVNSVTQVCYVDSIRHSTLVNDDSLRLEDAEVVADGEGAVQAEAIPPEMIAWQRNRMDQRQMGVTRAFVTHGITYSLTCRDKRNRKHARFEFYTAGRATALYDDPVNDTDPIWGLVIKRGNAQGIALAHLYSETDWWEVRPGKKDSLELTHMGKHGNSVCPVSRAVLHQDLEGRVTGIVEPCIEPQNQINQTSFDALTLQSWSSFKVRTVTGMALPVRRWSKTEIDLAFPRPAEDASPEEWHAYEIQDVPRVGDPILDQNGQEIPLPVNISQRRALVAEDPDTRFGTLDETNATPVNEALIGRVKNLAAISQTPPTYFMTELANLSAEALQTAEISKTRRDGEVRMSLAEMYERTLNLGMELEGNSELAEDVAMEIKWADTDPRSLAATVDALGKMVEMLEVPAIAAWMEIPGMTSGKLGQWMRLKREFEEEHPEVEMMQKLSDYGSFGIADPAGEVAYE